MQLEKLDIILGLLYATGDEGAELTELSEITGLSEIQIEDLVKTFRHPLFIIKQFGSRLYLMTNDALNPYLENLVTKSAEKKLTQASLETLAIIAYNQPVTRHDIEMMRSVNSDGPVRTLIEKGLIESKEADGRKHELFTTEYFLAVFGLKSLDDLPRDEEDNMEEMDQFFKSLEDNNNE